MDHIAMFAAQKGADATPFEAGRRDALAVCVPTCQLPALDDRRLYAAGYEAGLREREPVTSADFILRTLLTALRTAGVSNIYLFGHIPENMPHIMESHLGTVIRVGEAYCTQPLTVEKR